MQMKYFLGVLFLLGGITLLLTPTALASCPVPEINANGEFFKRDVVFTGIVTSVRYAKRDEGGWFYRLRVRHIFRGSVQEEFTVYTEDTDVRFPLEKDHEYLLFADWSHGRLKIDNCGNSALLSKAVQSLQQIQSIASSALDGEVEGSLAPETSGVDLSGIHVIIRSGSQVYYAVTNKNGWFHFRAPEGSYKVDFSNGEYYLNGGDSFWYNPEHFTLHAGESAALQMVSVRHPNK
jgi:hypothetical protein